jgi:NADH dehydrogenase FAD-containing subunit/NAD-dependent dihydropyrimidine dehydrogenase PreA subunit
MQLAEMGVKFQFNTSLGKEISLEKLLKEFDSVILAIGMSKSKTLDLIESTVPAKKRTDALTFLKAFNLHLTPNPSPKERGEKVLPFGQPKVATEGHLGGVATVLVIGGGNSAIDAARSAKKLSALNKVIISCIETENSMPAFAEEVKHAAEEDIEFIHDSFVKGCSVEKSGAIKIELHSFDNKKHLQDLKCDYIITAIGQTTDVSLTENLSKDENLRVKSENSFSGYKNIFVAGDISSGNNMSVIGSIASGKKAAVAVRKLLENYKYGYEGEKALERLNNSHLTPLPDRQAGNPSPKERGEKVLPFGQPKVGSEARLGGVWIEQYNLYQSCYKCNHCIDNFGCPAMVKVGGKVQIDMSRCNLCGLCIDVCPNNAIHWEVVEEEVLEPEEAK